MLDTMTQRQEAFKEKYGGGRASDLYTKEGDIVHFHVIRDDRHYGEIYVAHDVPQPGSQYGKLVYCPTMSFHDDNAAQHTCAYCGSDDVRPDGSPAYPLKQRVMLWLWVHSIFRPIAAANERDKRDPIVTIGSTQYHHRQVNGPMLWEVSGWQTFSPIPDFNIIRDNLNGDICSKMLAMRQIGRGLDMRRRFDIIDPSGPLSPEQMAEAEKLQPITAVLMERLKNASASGDTVRKSDWTPQQQSAADTMFKAAGHTPYQATHAAAAPNEPPPSDPEGFTPRQYTFDPDDPFGDGGA